MKATACGQGKDKKKEKKEIRFGEKRDDSASKRTNNNNTRINSMICGSL